MFSKLIASSIFALSLGRALAGVQFAGVNIAGFDFSCGTDVLLSLFREPKSLLMACPGYL